MTTMERAVENIVKLYENDSAGGEFHVAVDDGNWDSLEWCWALAVAESPREDIPMYTRLYDSLKKLTERGQEKAARRAREIIRSRRPK